MITILIAAVHFYDNWVPLSEIGLNLRNQLMMRGLHGRDDLTKWSRFEKNT